MQTRPAQRVYRTWIIDSTRWDREAQERHIVGLLRVRERQQAAILAPGSAEAGQP